LTLHNLSDILKTKRKREQQRGPPATLSIL